MFVTLRVDVSEDEADFAVADDVGDSYRGFLPAVGGFGFDLLEFDALLRQREFPLAVGTDEGLPLMLGIGPVIDYRW